jgi:hypothetical protein
MNDVVKIENHVKVLFLISKNRQFSHHFWKQQVPKFTFQAALIIS